MFLFNSIRRIDLKEDQSHKNRCFIFSSSKYAGGSYKTQDAFNFERNLHELHSKAKKKKKSLIINKDYAILTPAELSC